MMKHLFFFMLGTIVGAATSVGFGAALPVAESSGNQALPECLAGVTLTLKANPALVTLGQRSRLSWSVTAPEECDAVHVQLNHEAVALSGAETVMPMRNTMFTLMATESHDGQSARKQAVVRVTVIYPLQVVIDRDGDQPAKPVGAREGAGAMPVGAAVAGDARPGRFASPDVRPKDT
jgi:hypothetical protein